ncbi:MAG TPA: hypothetical protein VGK74_23580 [Symbiobacteriaceae bacterium]
MLDLNHLLGLIESRQWDAAWKEFGRLKAEGPQTPRLMLMGSHTAFGKRDLFAARHLAEAALASWTASEPLKLLGQIRFHLGMVTRELGDTHVALEQFDHFLAELHPKYPELSMGEGKAHFYRALTLRQRRDLEGAVAAYQKALTCFRRDELPTLLCKGLQNLAWLFCYMKRPGEAAECLAEAEPLVKDPVDQTHQALGEAFLATIEGRDAEAASLCESIFRRGERDESITAEERSQTAWIAATVALKQRNLESASALADVALRYASDAKDSRLINDAGALRREIHSLRQAGA